MPEETSTDDVAATSTKKKRETPWSVLIAAAVVFAIGMWLYLDVRREVKEMEAQKGRAPAAQTAKPKILGLDVIPQLPESNEAKAPATPSSVPTASATASSAPAASVSAAPLPSGPAPK